MSVRGRSLFPIAFDVRAFGDPRLKTRHGLSPSGRAVGRPPLCARAHGGDQRRTFIAGFGRVVCGKAVAAPAPVRIASRRAPVRGPPMVAVSIRWPRARGLGPGGIGSSGRMDWLDGFLHPG